MSLDPFPSVAELKRMARERGVLPLGKGSSDMPRPTAIRPYHPFRNKWELDYSRHLDVEKAAGLIADYEYESMRFEIGVGATYRPDFPVLHNDGSREIREVKGFKREAGMVRLKVAAQMFPQYRWTLVTKKQGQWCHTAITPTAPALARPRGARNEKNDR